MATAMRAWLCALAIGTRRQNRGGTNKLMVVAIAQLSPVSWKSGAAAAAATPALGVSVAMVVRRRRCTPVISLLVGSLSFQLSRLSLAAAKSRLAEQIPDRATSSAAAAERSESKIC
jgi:hypothetical protein